MSEQVANEQHPLIKKIAEYCKVLSVKVQQIQQISLGETEGSTPQYYWTVTLPDLKVFAFKDIGDVATALNMILVYQELSNKDKAADTFTTRGVQIIEKKVLEISGEAETLEQIADETEDEEPPAFAPVELPPTAVKLDRPEDAPPAEPVQLAGTGGSQFAERQKARAQAATHPSLIKQQRSSGAKNPIVVGSRTLV